MHSKGKALQITLNRNIPREIAGKFLVYHSLFGDVKEGNTYYFTNQAPFRKYTPEIFKYADHYEGVKNLEGVYIKLTTEEIEENSLTAAYSDEETGLVVVTDENYRELLSLMVLEGEEENTFSGMEAESLIFGYG